MESRNIARMGARAGALLKERKQKIAVAETSAGGLISASLLAVPGASAYFAGGAITYSKRAVRGLIDLSPEELALAGIRSSTEAYARLLAETVRSRHGTITWGLSETGAAGPGNNAYGDPAGHTCLAVAGPVTLQQTLRTASDDRVANMWAFAEAALALLVNALEQAPR